MCRTHVLVFQTKKHCTQNEHSDKKCFSSNASICCLEHSKEWSDSTKKACEIYWIPHSCTAWHQQGGLTLLSHMVENLVCLVVVDVYTGDQTHFSLLFYSIFLVRYFLSECSFLRSFLCALCCFCAFELVFV